MFRFSEAMLSNAHGCWQSVLNTARYAGQGAAPAEYARDVQVRFVKPKPSSGIEHACGCVVSYAGRTDASLFFSIPNLKVPQSLTGLSAT